MEYPLAALEVPLLLESANQVTHACAPQLQQALIKLGIFMFKNIMLALALMLTHLNVAAESGPSSAPLYAATFTGLDGRQVNLAQLQGKVVVVNFWATWCPPCLKEMPVLVAAYAKHQNQGIAFIGIAVDDDTELVKKFAREHKVNFPLATGKEKSIVLMQTLGNSMAGLPYTLVLDAQGNIVATKLGAISPARLEQALQKAANTAAAESN